MSHLALGFALVLFVLAIHPFASYPLSLLLIYAARGRDPSRGFNREAGQYDQSLTFAICVCAYNEAGSIGATLERLILLREREPGLEILVYVDAATDGTWDIARRFEPDVRVFSCPERHGKTHGMNFLVSQTSASIIMFVDANVKVDAEATIALRKWFSEPSIGCVTSNLIYTTDEHSVTAQAGASYWRFEQQLKRLEQEVLTSVGADGSCFAVRRALYRPPEDHIIDDMFVSMKVILQGARCVQARDVIAVERSIPSSREEFRRKTRIACQAFNVHRLLKSEISGTSLLFRYMYYSHKFLRWFSGILLVLAVVFAALGLLAGGHLAVVGAAVAALGVGWGLGVLGVPLFSTGVEVVRALAATSLGLWQSIRGERYQTWAPAASIRR